MSNRFLKPVMIEEKVAGPSFVRTNVDTQSIVNAGKPTTGSKIMDIAFDTAIKIAEKNENAQRINENAELEIELNKDLQALESSWSGLDKYSDENYTKYKEELDNVYAKNKEKLNTTKFTTREDVDSWNNKYESSYNNVLYKNKGEKAVYDTKQLIGRTTLNMEALINDSAYDSNEQTSNDKMNQVFALADTLAPYIGETELLKMKSNSMNKQIQLRSENQINDVINSDKPIYEKRQILNGFRNGINSNEVFEANMNNLNFGKISADDKKIIAGNAKKYMEENVNKAGGLYERIDNQIKNQEYQEFIKVETTKNQLQKSLVNETLSVDSNVRGGNPIIAINTIEEQAYTPSSLMSDSVTMTKYFGGTTYDIVNKGGYVQMYATSETQRMKQELDVNDLNGTKRDVALTNVRDEINSYESSDQKENVKRSLIARGVITPAEAELMDRPDGGAIINDIHLGKTSKIGSKILFSNIPGKSSQLRNQVEGLTPYQQELLSSIIGGKIASGEIGWAKQTQVNAVTVNSRYNSDPAFKELFDNAIQDVRTIHPAKIQEVKADRRKFTEAVEKKHREKNVHLNQADGMKTINVKRPGVKDESFTDSLLD